VSAVVNPLSTQTDPLPNPRKQIHAPARLDLLRAAGYYFIRTNVRTSQMMRRMEASAKGRIFLAVVDDDDSLARFA
jgi:hypothetical protein